MTRTAAAVRSAGALLTLAGLVAGVPSALWRSVGWPLPHTMPSLDQAAQALSMRYLPDEVIINTLAVLCWITWARLTAFVAVETAAAVRSGIAAHPSGGGPLRRLAAQLVAAALAAALTTPRPAAAVPPRPPAAELAVEADLTLTAAARPQTGQPQPAAGPTHSVRRYDDLWSIAQTRLGDPYRWPQIWELNRHRRFPDGRTFTHPDLIHPGWTLRLPADAAPDPDCEPPSAAASAASPPAAAEPPPPADAAETPPAAPSAPRPKPATPAPPAASNGPHARPRAPVNGERPAAEDRADDEPEDEDEGELPPGIIRLPSGARVGLTLAAGVSAAMVTAQLHRSRRWRPAQAEPGASYEEPWATDAVRRLRRAELAHHGPEPDRLPKPGPEHPDEAAVVTIGARDGHPIHLDLCTVGGVCLTGPAAPDIARAVALDFLARQQPCLTELLVAGPALADALLPGRRPIPGLDVREDLTAALTRLEFELVQRARLIDEVDGTDFSAFTRRYPAEPMPALLLLVEQPPPAARARLAAVLSQGRRLGISALILGEDPDLPTVTVDDAARVLDIQPAAALPHLAWARLCTLTVQDAAELLAVLAARHDLQPEDEDPDEPQPAAAADDQPAPAGPAILVRLLGPLRIEARGGTVDNGLRGQGRELLAYLALHPDGVSAETAAEALSPAVDATKAAARFRAVLSTLQKALRQHAGLPADTVVIPRAGRNCRLDPAIVDCDLWRFEAALADAENAPDDPAAVPPLEEAAARYRGDLVQAEPYDWAEPARHQLRRRAVDALTLLADLHEQHGEPERSLAALEQAIRHDPHAEPLYQQIMRLQTALGRPDAVERTYRLLRTRLAELDAEPDPATERLLGSPEPPPTRPGRQ